MYTAVPQRRDIPALASPSARITTCATNHEQHKIRLCAAREGSGYLVRATPEGGQHVEPSSHPAKRAPPIVGRVHEHQERHERAVVYAAEKRHRRRPQREKRHGQNPFGEPGRQDHGSPVFVFGFYFAETRRRRAATSRASRTLRFEAPLANGVAFYGSANHRLLAPETEREGPRFVFGGPVFSDFFAVRPEKFGSLFRDEGPRSSENFAKNRHFPVFDGPVFRASVQSLFFKVSLYIQIRKHLYNRISLRNTSNEFFHTGSRRKWWTTCF